MYANLLETNVVATWVSSDSFTHAGKSVPVLDAVATCDDSMQKWSLALVNRHPDEQLHCNVVVGRNALAGRHKVTMLCGDSPDAYNNVEYPDRVTPCETEVGFENGKVDVPPHSVIVIWTS